MINEQHHSDEVRGVVVPSIGLNLLLPNAAVAEVTALHEPTEIAAVDAPWLFGDVEWRGLSIPVVAIGSGEDTVRSALAFSHLKLVVCYTPGGRERLRYLGIFSTGMPHLVRFNANVLLPPVVELDVPFALQQLVYEDFPACIPDLDAVAEAILALPEV